MPTPNERAEAGDSNTTPADSGFVREVATGMAKDARTGLKFLLYGTIAGTVLGAGFGLVYAGPIGGATCAVVGAACGFALVGAALFVNMGF